jgi:hypothetical protein
MANMKKPGARTSKSTTRGLGPAQKPVSPKTSIFANRAKSTNVAPKKATPMPMAKPTAKATPKTTTKAPAKVTPKPKTTKKPEKMTPEDAAMKKILESKYGKIYG